MLLTALLGWLEREQREVIEFLREENRVLKAIGGTPQVDNACWPQHRQADLAG